MSINGSIKKRGRPATGVNTSINVRIPPDELAAIDNWISEQDDDISRPEAIRRLVRLVLESE